MEKWVEPEETPVESPETPEYNPLDGGPGTAIATLITNMRLYDVMMGMYAEMDDDKAAALIELHASGKIVGSAPNIDM